MKTIIMLLLLAPAMSVASIESPVYRLNCGGTEPFWSVDVDGATLSYQDPVSNGKADYTGGVVREANGMSNGYAFQIKATGENGKKNIELSIINAGEKGCSDGMSDRNYKYHVLADINGELLYGCCD